MIRVKTIQMENPHDAFVADYRKARFLLVTCFAARLGLLCHHYGLEDEPQTARLKIQAPMDKEPQKCLVQRLIDNLIDERLLPAVEIHCETTEEYDWFPGFFELRHMEMPANIVPPPQRLVDLRFFRDRVAFAMERDRLEKSTHNPPFDNFTERTVDSTTAGDVTTAMRDISDEEEAQRFVAGYIEEMAQKPQYGPRSAREAVIENLRMGAGKSFSDKQHQSLLEIWEKALSSY